MVTRWKAKLSSWTANGMACTLRAILKIASAQTGQPVPKLPHTKRGARRSRIATPEELQLLYANARPEFRWLLCVWTELGLRFSEGIRIAPRDINFENHTVHVIAKGNKHRMLPTTPHMELLASLAFPFPDGEEATPIVNLIHGYKHHGRWPTPRNIARTHWANMKKAGKIPADLRPHDLRRTMATTLFRQTHDVVAVQQMLGHDDLATTSHYLKPHEPTEMRKLLDQLHWNWTPAKKGEPVQ
jgi:integrase